MAEEIVDEDDEETLLEQEKAERGKVDHKKELEELEKEGIVFAPITLKCIFRILKGSAV